MCHLLIIEDEWLLSEHLVYLAELAGATSIATAFTEDEAVEAAMARRPDVIFSDVNLLKGTGTGAVQSIRSALGNIPVIFVTGRPAACEQCEAPLVVLEKPVNSALLIEAYIRFAHLR